MKIISMYLPQFHRVKENDEWWGEGFTEWTAVKQARPLFEGHYQPHVPLNHNYYDLLDKKTMRWQADLMKKYGIDGQCIYHYWFKQGRQILEKPAENLLGWTDIDMPFCFCWANESWARTWSRWRGSNSWSSELEPEQQNNDNGLLLEQDYGSEEDWREHFNYLLPFFKDERYIRIDGKPVFVLYKTSDIYCLREMMDVWKMLARKEGVPGIYLIGANDIYGSDVIDLALLGEPNHAIGELNEQYKERKGIFRCRYTDIWDKILGYSINGEKISIQGIVGRDDTPRNGQNGRVVENTEPELFREYLSELIAKNLANGCELTFINAWNEWGEGMHLEPDEKNGYGFLEGISYAKAHYADYGEKYSQDWKKGNSRETEYLKTVNKRYRSYWMVLSDWLTLKEQGIKLEQYFLNRGEYFIAIYGIGLLGKHLYYELEDSEIKIKYIVDRGASFKGKGVTVYRPEDELPDVDVIVVTATYAYNEISRQLSEKGFENIVSLEEVIAVQGLTALCK